MKLCFFIDDITHTGGIERVTSNLVHQFSKDQRNIDVEIVSQYKSSNRIWYPFGNCIIKYLSDKNFDAKPHSISRIVTMLGNINAVRQYFKKHSYDFIIAQSLPNVFALFMAGVDMSKVIATEHVYYNYYNSIIKKIRIFIYKKCYKVAVLTSEDKKCYDRYFDKTHTVLIPNPVIVPEYFESHLNNKVAIAMGRIQYQKGFDTLVDVFAMVHQKHPDWKVHIYGDGNYRNYIEEYIKERNMNDIVVLKGRTDDVASVMRNASFFILSSRFEGFGMVIAEAMSQGLPVVSFDCPTGPSDMVKSNFNGLLVENQNKKALAEAICYMIEHPNERKKMGRNAIETSKQFAGNIISKKWYSVFNL